MCSLFATMPPAILGMRQMCLYQRPSVPWKVVSTYTSNFPSYSPKTPSVDLPLILWMAVPSGRLPIAFYSSLHCLRGSWDRVGGGGASPRRFKLGRTPISVLVKPIPFLHFVRLYYKPVPAWRTYHADATFVWKEMALIYTKVFIQRAAICGFLRGFTQSVNMTRY